MTEANAQQLRAGSLRRRCDRAALGFASTAEVEPLETTIGQPRADEAVEFGLEARMPGYNVFVTGAVGTGKRTSLELRMHEFARSRPAPGDWVYLHNFRDPRTPLALSLSSGRAHELQADMRRFLADARRELMTALESATYAQRQREAAEPLEREQESALSELREQARASGIALELTPAGLATVPLRGTHPMTPAQFAELPESVRARYQAAVEQLEPGMQAFITRMRTLQREGRDRLRALEREVAMFAIGHLIDELRERHGDSPKLSDWLTAVAEDITENLRQFQPQAQESAQSWMTAVGGGPEQALARYEVNAFVAHDSDGGAPVVVETNPTYPNLFGRIEHHGTFGGGLVTDHRMLRPGAAHRANGGYLMLPAAEVLAQPLLWLKLKAILKAGRIRLENPAEQYALLSTVTLTPEPIELDLKLVLVGSPALYQLAYMVDEDVRKLFRVKAEFDWRVPWDSDGERDYAAFLSSQVKRAGLLHFDAGAVARVIEHGARLTESQEWLSTVFVEIAGLAAEASHRAAADSNDVVSAEHVERAIEHKIRRSDLIERRLLDMVAEGALLLDVEGKRVGQLNGLSVLDLGDYTFGRPVRISASAGPGRGALVSIERETELSGPIHDKGFLTLTGYLRERYGRERRIALSATLTFEQSYDRIDGDSAASAELYALLSELAGVPLRQDLAVTGSVNQHAEVQAVGGVNQKIEGFYRACKLKGLTGTQGVVIPDANTRHLMVSDEVVDSVAKGRFHIYSVRDIDQGLELLTGVPAGKRGDDGRFPDGTVHALVEERLERWARLDEQHTTPPESTG
ncbi:MAG: Lon protease family protein [Solirubrobacteraceae bacterium]